MSNANRIPLRKQYREDHPAQFGRTAKQAVAGVKIAKRRSFYLYRIEMLQPKLYAKLVEHALGKAGVKPNPDGEIIVDDPAQIDAIAAALDASHGATP